MPQTAGHDNSPLHAHQVSIAPTIMTQQTIDDDNSEFIKGSERQSPEELLVKIKEKQRRNKSLACFTF